MTTTQYAAERAGLLAAIRDTPEDDAPRLIYADLLAENDETDRAEFIRVQCRLARMRFPGVSPSAGAWKVERDELRRREDELIRFNASRWLREWLPEELMEGFGTWTHEGPVIHSKRSVLRTVVWRRGFVSEIRAPLATLLDHGAAILGEHPVTRMVVTDRQPAERAVKRFGWYWVSDDDYPDRQEEGTWIVPYTIWDRLRADNHKFDSRDAALEALHAAVLAECYKRLRGEVST